MHCSNFFLKIIHLFFLDDSRLEELKTSLPSPQQLHDFRMFPVDFEKVRQTDIFKWINCYFNYNLDMQMIAEVIPAVQFWSRGQASGLASKLLQTFSGIHCAGPKVKSMLRIATLLVVIVTLFVLNFRMMTQISIWILLLLLLTCEPKIMIFLLLTGIR